jgi:hypothetical protein
VRQFLAANNVSHPSPRWFYARVLDIFAVVSVGRLSHKYDCVAFKRDLYNRLISDLPSTLKTWDDALETVGAPSGLLYAMALIQMARELKLDRLLPAAYMLLMEQNIDKKVPAL